MGHLRGRCCAGGPVACLAGVITTGGAQKWWVKHSLLTWHDLPGGLQAVACDLCMLFYPSTCRCVARCPSLRRRAEADEESTPRGGLSAISAASAANAGQRGRGPWHPPEAICKVWPSCFEFDDVSPHVATCRQHVANGQETSRQRLREAPLAPAYCPHGAGGS